MRYLCKRSDGVFVVFRTNDIPKGFIKSKKTKKLLANAHTISVPTEKGFPFFILDIPSSPSNSQWEEIARKCGRYVSRIVAPRSLSIPEYGGMKRFLPLFMPSLLVFNTALETIKKSAPDPYKISITLTDRNAFHPSRVHKLLPFSSSVRIITAHPEKYALTCKKALDEYGASLILRSSYEVSGKTDIVICSDGGISPQMHSAIIFSHRPVTAGIMNFCGSGIALSEKHSSLIPADTDPIDFAGAVTELCSDGEYKNAVFSDVLRACNICDNPTTDKCLECCIGGGCNKVVT